MTNRTERYTPEQVAEALKDYHGMIAPAARALGCAENTVRRYIATYEDVRQVRADERESMVSLAESKLFEAVERGELAAVLFTLKTQGRHRGYVERNEQELSQRGGAPLPSTTIYAGFSTDELRAIAERVSLGLTGGTGEAEPR